MERIYVITKLLRQRFQLGQNGVELVDGEVDAHIERLIARFFEADSVSPQPHIVQ